MSDEQVTRCPDCGIMLQGMAFYCNCGYDWAFNGIGKGYRRKGVPAVPEAMTLDEFNRWMTDLLDRDPSTWTEEERAQVERMCNILVQMAKNFNARVKDTLDTIIRTFQPVMQRLYEERKKYDGE